MVECPYCKTVNSDQMRFCSNCGRYVGTTSAPAISSADAAVSPPPDPGRSYRALAAGARLQGGRYVVKKVLGQGGMGAALLATDLRLDNKLVVLKELISDSVDPVRLQEDVRNFKREVSMLAHIDHPLVPSVTDHFQEGARYFMVQEFVDGENLEERLARTNQPLKEREALICTSEMLDVLDYLAQQNSPIVHRDIKPANIIIGSRDRKAHLVDFGIARADVARNARRKQTAALGTPGYAPPEQYQGNADPRSDLYGLAATLHHLLTNRDPRNHPPFQFPPVRVLNPQVSVETERLLMRALQNDMNQRYQSAASMRQEIDEILRQRFGLVGNIDSYALGMSGSMVPVTGTPADSGALAPTLHSSSPLTPVQPLIASGPPPPPDAQYPTVYAMAPPVAQSGPHLPIVPQTPSAPGLTSLGAVTPGQLPVSPQRKKPRRMGLYIVLTLLLLLVVMGGGIFAALRFLNLPLPGLPSQSTGIGIDKVGGEPIGLSDGSYVFDTTRENGAVKNQAAQEVKQVLDERGDNYDAALSRLNEALKINSNDAEALIYKENLMVLKSGEPYITLVVATMLTGSRSGWIGTGHDNLQGAYVGQKEFNDGARLKDGTRIRLLIANSGGAEENVERVAQRIVQAAQHDKTIVGVLGWPYSAQALRAQSILGAAHIPMVAQTASSDALSGVSPYFFRVAPSNKYQALQAVTYAMDKLQTSRAAVFYDEQNSYTKTLAQGFIQEFTAKGGQIVSEQKYTVQQPGTLPGALKDALTKSPDVIYFAGYSDDISVLLSNPLPEGLPVLGGDALYQLGGYSQSARASGFRHLHFTAFAYPDEWGVLGYEDRKPDFFSRYPLYFDPEKEHQNSPNPYGYTRAANDVILSYDGMLALLHGVNLALNSGKETITPEDVRVGLTQIKGERTIQGVSGQIAFDEKGDPIDKAIVLLHVSPEGFIQMEPEILGKFLVEP